ncbi:proline iminopeptidase [Gonapodya prolifera JEL478]|uniref:Proline iminopeptidase n=1 Tax=Gonapodya prolifera (strain JEL478) TaxID=1344416 RepID=A0A139A8M7_GONPJ|nr:proline iminopeptidase [Gonapodya prolifera JEL478]|eukprot:KXS13087.1 proline iminopeptidase [Gonapodya prolifera JEL478]
MSASSAPAPAPSAAAPHPPHPQTGFSSDPNLRLLYPPIEPYKTHSLKVDGVHTLYVEECGNQHGVPVVFLHGGPGGGCGVDDRRFFNPSAYRVILFDQRGAGRSTPPAELKDNDTWKLVEDVERVRALVGVERWHVFGGSWGSTLALSYAITYPTRVVSLTLRGIFLLRPAELAWFYQNPSHGGGAAWIYPDAFEPYEYFIPEAERGDLVKAYYDRLVGDREEVKKEAARRWAAWECGTSRLAVDEGLVAKAENPAWAMAFARIEAHYFRHAGFFPTDSWILDNVDKIRHIPAVIVQGRYDVVCPAKSAWDLHRAWPEAEFCWLQDCGHSAKEPGIRDRLVRATDRFGGVGTA